MDLHGYEDVKGQGKLWICIEYRKLIEATITNVFPLPSMDGLFDMIAATELYSFLDGFSGYTLIRMAIEDQEKTAFILHEMGRFRGSCQDA